MDYRRGTDRIESRLEEIKNSYLKSIEENLWVLNRAQLEIQLEGLVRLPDITAAEVHETSPGEHPIAVSVGRRTTGSAITRTTPILHSIGGTDQQIGVFYVEASLDPIYRELMDEVLVILLGQGAKTFLVSLFILYIFHRLVTRHLVTIAQFADRYDVHQPSMPLGLRREREEGEDELAQVVGAFNRLCENLRHSYDELRETNVKLEQDILARGRIEEALRQSEQRFRDYAGTASDWFWETGPEHELTSLWAGQVGFKSDLNARIGARWWEMAADIETEPEKWHEYRGVFARHEPFRDFLYTMCGGKGELSYISASGIPVFEAEGRFRGYRGVARDVTAMVLSDQILREAKEQAEAASRTKSAFLANMSHELRTPLNAVIGMAEMINAEMLGPVGNERYRVYAGDILVSGEHLLSIINDILDVAKIEAGEFTLDEREFDLCDVVVEVARILTVQANVAGIDLIVAPIPGVPRLRADTQAIRRVLFNLLSNALKFTAQGGTVTVVPRRLPSGDVEVSIEDTGIGIAAEDISKLMQPFTQLENVYQRRNQGAGLGLALARLLVEGHGGSIAIESRPGHGTTVTIRLPAVRFRQDVPMDPPPA